MGDVAGVVSKVDQWLKDLELNYIHPEDDLFMLGWESVRVTIRVVTREGDASAPTWVKFLIPVLHEVNDTPEVYEHVAFHADDYLQGHLSLYRQEDSTLSIFFTHNLLADYIDFEEFARAFFATAGTADDLDDALQPQFGGKRWREEK